MKVGGHEVSDELVEQYYEVLKFLQINIQEMLDGKVHPAAIVAAIGDEVGKLLALIAYNSGASGDATFEDWIVNVRAARKEAIEALALHHAGTESHH